MMSKTAVYRHFKSLQLDNMNIDASLAKKFISQNEGSLTAVSNKIENVKLTSEKTRFELCKALRRVAESIKRHEDVFAQLEYLNSGVCPEEVKQYDIQLLIKSLNDTDPFKVWPKQKGVEVTLKDEEPLAILGFVAYMLASNVQVKLLTVDDQKIPRKAACLLFANICHEAGFTEAEIAVYQNQKTSGDHLINQFYADMNVNKVLSSTGTRPGCAVVVTGKTDVDSAVEAICAATHHHQYPWRIRRVLVQESILEQFQRSLSRKVTGTSSVDETLKSICQTMQVGDKVFLFDYPRLESDLEFKKPYVLIEGYRTTKELISLLKKYELLYISLWCNDLSICHEITDRAQTVWVNDYGIFVESQLCVQDYVRPIEVHHSPRALKLLQKAENMRSGWLKLSLEARKAAILDYFEQNTIPIDDVTQFVWSFSPRSFANVNKGVVCSGTEVPRVTVIVVNNENEDQILKLKALYQCVLSGCAVVINDTESSIKEHPKIPIIVSDLQREEFDAGVAISYKCLWKYFEVFCGEKVVYTRFGETFAN